MCLPVGRFVCLFAYLDIYIYAYVCICVYVRQIEGTQKKRPEFFCVMIAPNLLDVCLALFFILAVFEFYEQQKAINGDINFYGVSLFERNKLQQTDRRRDDLI